jgi:thiamine-phosphate pyrophosphorylase
MPRIRLHFMQLCAITDRREATQPLVSLVESWSAGGVHFIQLREKDLSADALESLAREIMGKIDRSRSKLLINVSTLPSVALAMAAGTDGVHLAGKPRTGLAGRVRQTFGSITPIISVPCHSLEDIDVAVQEEVDLMLFSPVFEKVSGRKVSEEKVSGEKLSAQVQGLEGLRRACAAARGKPVFALGGVTADNASDCVAMGAAGIAGIRLFAGEDWRRLQNGQPSLANHI